MHGVQPNPPRGGANPLQSGLHILQSRGMMPEMTLGHQSVHPFESAQIDDGVALNEGVQNRLDGVALNDQMQNLLDIIDLDYDEVEILLDQHQDMRLDMNNMSYEEFIALGERIGSVSTGLHEERITDQLETRVYIPYPNCTNLEELPFNDKEIVVCTICQTEFEDQEKIGILQCKH
ncbi:hypothetical protein MtrunA17_Chr2g0315681 [Medicago truncatula]|uniref:RING-type E3 ubiquitin transferase n=1 Tax=Medicago truncatula TaxID=3880 RepID=Q2HS95_MEDTR|nr:hypothetical protein MtrDRAFT_AC151598g46v2 [Medicago truncatula]RHN74934.1 hypothetical protein MtrunA17_Chr2g0315681 [Medicago truncatula]